MYTNTDVTLEVLKLCLYYFSLCPFILFFLLHKVFTNIVLFSIVLIVKNTLKHLKVTLGTQCLSAIPLSNVLGCPCQNLEVRENVENEFGVPQEKQADHE